jgi:SAM-dependent methyltransferase
MSIADDRQRKSQAVPTPPGSGSGTGAGGAARGLPGKVPLGMRLKAWWDGYDLEVRRRLVAEEAAPGHEVRYERERLAWETPRIDLAQELWGEGFNSPGEADQTRALIKPVGLDESMSVLEIGSGLGGSARLIAQEFGSWVTALEPNPGLAQAAAALSEMHGLSRKANVQACDIENLEVKRAGYDCILARQALFGVENKLGALSAIAEGLKAKGQLILTDFVKGEPWRPEDYAETIKELGLDLRVAADVTDAYREALVEGWSGFMADVAKKQLDPERAQILKEEAELWTLRKAALDAGELKLYRFHALSTRASKLLSDW